MFAPHVTCSCGFEARTPEAAALWREHKCKQAVNWPQAAALLGLFAMIGFEFWVVFR